MKSLDPRDYDWVNNSYIYDWRQFLKRELIIKRKRRSDWSGKLLTGCEMHEGILTRADVPKGVTSLSGLEWHYFIYNEMNCFLLLPEEHRPNPPSREWAIQKAYELYGREAVQKWYYSLPFKVFPFKLL